MTPAETPDSTASVKRRRWSIFSLAESSSSRCDLTWLVMVLKVVGEQADIAGRAAGRHADVEVAARKSPAPRRSAAGSATTRLRAKPSPIQMAERSTTSATPAKTMPNATCTPNLFA